MAKEIGEGRKRGSSAGSFFGGTLFGFLLCILVLAGLGAFVYFKVSPKWVNDTFNTKIDLGSDELNRLTLNEAVSQAISLSQNMDTYTINNLETDFGINLGDKFKGIDISDIKNVPLANLGAEIQNKLTQISAAELEEELISFSGDIDQIMSSTYTYYFDDEDKKLCHDAELNNVVEDSEFKYTYNQETNQIVIKGTEFDINSGKVEITLRHLPLMTALGGFSNLTIADVMGFSHDGSSYYYDANGNTVKDAGEELSAILNVLGGTTIEQLPTRVNTLTLADMFAPEERTGIISLIDNPEKVLLTGETQGEYLSISDAFAKVMTDKTMGQLEEVGVLTGESIEDALDLWIDVDEDFTDTVHTYEQVKTLTLTEFMTASIANLAANNLIFETNPNA